MTHPRLPVAPPRGLRTSAARLEGNDVDDGPIVVFSWPVPAPCRPGLSAAERDVVALVIAGRTNAEIAALRGRSLGTIKKQIASAYRKLGVGSRSELAAHPTIDLRPR